MARRGFWKGYLKLSLVTCPVAMTPATSEAEKIRFHTLNRATGNRVSGIYVDAETGKVVDDDDQARGYEREPGNYVVLDDDQLDAVALDSNRTINIETFVPADSVEWIWYDKPHFLMPDDKVGEEAFAVIREAMVATDTVGIARLVLYRRERVVMLEPRLRGIVLWTLHYADEVRPPQDYLDNIPGEVDADMVGLIGKLIDKRSKAWDGSDVRDPMQGKLKALISARKKATAGKSPPRRAKDKDGDETPTNVVNIMDVLKASLASEMRKRR
ncbi:Ku protein [Ancylobacter sonchi]|uniref:non-homologous end joining protein Ku n=1 Tax=Ancylobacter sonchi TaxID=1937790 RepID=UPI001BD37C12|nr:Ku protein [Ancylobacter sonchi]MBS7533385.1 Ku protein [Ancylobacter sonchi]